MPWQCSVDGCNSFKNGGLASLVKSPFFVLCNNEGHLLGQRDPSVSVFLRIEGISFCDGLVFAGILGRIFSFLDKLLFYNFSLRL